MRLNFHCHVSCCQQTDTFVQVVEVELDRGGKHEAGLLSRPELEQMITWETNNLYEYLKELYDHKQQDMADNRSVSCQPSHHNM